MRKQAKTYGTCKIAEGIEIDGWRLCIVEDVVTSGGAILDAAVELRHAARSSARSRASSIANQVVAKSSPTPSSICAALYTMSELKAAAAAEGAHLAPLQNQPRVVHFVGLGSECEPS